MRRLKELIRTQLHADQLVSERATSCRRRGTMARAVLIQRVPHSADDEIVPVAAFAEINGGGHCSATPAGCGCVHAEQKLIVKMLKAGKKPDHLVYAMLTTLEPCEQCANLIVESGLFSVVAWLQEYRGGKGRDILRRANISVVDADSPFMNFRSSVE